MESTAATSPRRTPLYHQHLALDARMVDFAGWDMPLNYPSGVVAEHLSTRRSAGLFDVSHMGRFAVRGPDAARFLRRVLTNDAKALPVGMSHYTLLSDQGGAAIDDAYLCHFTAGEYILIVNAANRQRDWHHLREHLDQDRVELVDISDQLAMISLQGPDSERLLADSLEAGDLPEARRNSLAAATVAGEKVLLSRTGYTGEPLCFEILAPPDTAETLWSALIDKGASPTGLAARDTLRLEANLPLYGHEQGLDPAGREIPLLSCPVAAYGVDLEPTRGDFIGREALVRQQEASRLFASSDYSRLVDLPLMVRPITMTGRGIARAGSTISYDGREVGWVTSGTMVPYWKSLATDDANPPTGEHEMRSIGLAYLDSRITPGADIDVDIRGKKVTAVVVKRHLQNNVPPYARPVLHEGMP